MFLRSLTLIMLMTAFFAVPRAYAEGAFVDELRFGIVAANPEFLEHDHPEGDQFGVNAEVLFKPFNLDRRAAPSRDLVRTLLSPRLHVGADVNFDEDGTSLVYSGLTWQQDITDQLFVEASFGLSLNNGKENGRVENRELTRARLGSHVLFREQIALGYRVTETMNVVLSVSHNSHARLFDHANRGLTNISLKTGFRF